MLYDFLNACFFVCTYNESSSYLTIFMNALYVPLYRQVLTWVERIPYVGPKLEEPLLEFLRNQKAKLHKKDSSTPIEKQGSILSNLLEKFVLAMVVYFIISIVNTLAQNYSKRIGKKKGKKRE